MLKVALQYLFNVVILFNTAFYLNFKIKIDPKICTLKPWKKLWKPGWNVPKSSGNYKIKYLYTKLKNYTYKFYLLYTYIVFKGERVRRLVSSCNGNVIMEQKQECSEISKQSF